jgi:hypothetical protein
MKMFFNTINENMPTFEMAFSNYFMKKCHFGIFFSILYEKNCQNGVFSYYFMEKCCFSTFFQSLYEKNCRN